MRECGHLYVTACFISYFAFDVALFQKLEFYYMINYYFKYIELLDTLFLALKKKPLGTFYFKRSM